MGADAERVERHASGVRWESVVGYSRAVRAGDRVLISGTTATTPDGAIAGLGDPAGQARQIMANLERALRLAGATLADVVRTRIYLTDAGHFDAVARVHAQTFASVRPVNTTVVVAGLVDPRMLVEIEVEAFAPRE
jgi:enamine deaminase RidA (YjgF/YER057c/UK114 family)